MTALLDDFSVLQYQDGLCIADRRQAVGDDQAGASLHQLVQSPLDQDFTACIYVARCFVQQ